MVEKGMVMKMNSLPLKYVVKGKYSIKGKIGESDFSNVYMAGYNGKKYAVKECFPAQLVIRDDKYKVFTNKYNKYFEMVKESFRREAEILEMFNSENIVGLKDISEENGTFYLILEYCSGKTLKEYIQKESLEKSKLMEIFSTIMEAVSEIHEKGIVHRDIKPSNIIVDYEGNIKVIDFTSAIKSGEKNGKYVKLTEGYSPLEMYSTKSVNDVRTDIYSLSALLYFMVNRIKPMDSLKRFYYPELLYEDIVSENIKIFIGKGLRQERSDRYVNMEEMKKEFEKLGLKE